MRISDWSSDVCSSDPLEAPDVDLLAFELRRLKLGTMRVVACIGRGAARSQPIERGLRQIDVPLAHDVGHVLEEEGHQQGRDMRAIDRSEERSVGKEYVSTCRSRSCRDH